MRFSCSEYGQHNPCKVDIGRGVLFFSFLYMVCYDVVTLDVM